MGEELKILGIDEDRASQPIIAQAFNHAGVFYRFVSERRKALPGVQKMKPDLLLVFGEANSDLVREVLDAVHSDVAVARTPVVLMVHDPTEAPFVAGLRTGVVGLLERPFDARRHVGELRQLVLELQSRTGVSSGTGDSSVLARLVEHVRRTQRSGTILFNAGRPSQSRATFALGKLENAQFDALKGVEALLAMVAQPQADWTFAEVGGGGGDGAGVVIEVGGEEAGGDEEVVIAGEEVMSGPFEMPTAQATVPSAPAPSFKSNKLLLVDDDEALCRLFGTLFRKHGFQVTTAEDGLEGYAAAQKEPFDAVIADLNMPRMDGWGMLRQLRDDFKTREIPVAFLSCHDDYREALRAQNAGAQAYFAKGTRIDPLVGQVRKLLAPRAELEQKILSGQDFDLDVGAVGPQWLIGMLGTHKATGRLDARDSFATYQYWFHEGRPVHAAAQAGRYTAEGERAFNALISSRGAQGKLQRGHFPSPTTLKLDASAQLERSCQTLTDGEKRLKETLLVSATNIEVNPDLYAIYQQVGPRQWLEAARLICEEKVPPREVIARVELSPIEVEETLKDLLRRGVVNLKK